MNGFVRDPKAPPYQKVLRVVHLLLVVIYYRGAPCTNIILLDFGSIFLSKKGSRRSQYGGRCKNTMAQQFAIFSVVEVF